MRVLKGELKRESPMPLYYQLKAIILDEINSGRLMTGDYLPTENEFMESYQISRATVRQTMSELVNENYLSRQKGKGTFVTKPKIAAQYINRVETYKEQAKKMGTELITKVICCEVIKADVKVSKALNIQTREQVIHLIRVRSVDNEPIVIAETYMPYQTCGFILDHNLEDESLYEIFLGNRQTHITKAVRTIEAVIAGEIAASLLNIAAEDALQVIKTTAFNQSGEVIEYTIAQYRGDKNLFVVETQVDL